MNNEKTQVNDWLLSSGEQPKQEIITPITGFTEWKEKTKNINLPDDSVLISTDVKGGFETSTDDFDLDFDFVMSPTDVTQMILNTPP